MGLLDKWRSAETLSEPRETEPVVEEGESRDNFELKARVLAIFDGRDNIPEVVMQRMLGEIPVSGKADEIKQQVDGAVTALQNEGLIKFDPKTKEFSKVRQEVS